VTDGAKRKRDELIVRAGILFMAILLGYSFIFRFFQHSWAEYWLTKDPQQTMAIITGSRDHGIVDYKYVVAGEKYTGLSHRNWHDARYSNVGIGGQSNVYFSASHPWLSTLEPPQFPPSGVIVLIVALVFEFFFIVTVINPRSKWALNVFDHGQPQTKTYEPEKTKII
jgi:hypothetical protein